MTDTTDLRAALADIVQEVAGVPVDDVQPEKSFVEDLGVDSLSMVEIVVMAEDAFGVRIPDSEVRSLGTVGALIAHIHQARAAAGD